MIPDGLDLERVLRQPTPPGITVVETDDALWLIDGADLTVTAYAKDAPGSLHGVREVIIPQTRHPMPGDDWTVSVAKDNDDPWSTDVLDAGAVQSLRRFDIRPGPGPRPTYVVSEWAPGTRVVITTTTEWWVIETTPKKVLALRWSVDSAIHEHHEIAAIDIVRVGAPLTLTTTAGHEHDAGQIVRITTERVSPR